MAVRRRRKKTATRKKVVRRKRANPAKRKSAKRVAAGKKAARTRKRRATVKRANPVRRRKRRVVAKKRVVRRRRRRVVARANPAPRRRRRRKSVAVARRRNPQSTASRRRAALKGVRRKKTVRKRLYRGRRVSRTGIMTARKRIRRTRAGYGTRGARSAVRSYRMRTNPAGGATSFKGIMMYAAKVAGATYVARIASTQIGMRIPMISTLEVGGKAIGRPVVSLGLLVAGNYATKKVAMLKKHRAAILLGFGLNLVDSLVSAFAPEDLKAQIGVGDSDGLYNEAVGGYVEIGDYVEIGHAPPIDDDITLAGLSDYIEVGDIAAELGAMQDENSLLAATGAEAELGMLQSELGDHTQAPAWQRPRLGGVMPTSMLKPIPSRQMLAPIPARSFTKQIPQAGAGYDKASVLYTGIFGGGFGC